MAPSQGRSSSATPGLRFVSRRSVAYQPKDNSGVLADADCLVGFPILEPAASAQSSGTGVLDGGAAGTTGKQIVLHHHCFSHSWEFYRRVVGQSVQLPA